MKFEIQRRDLVVMSVFVLVPLVCIIVFLLPEEIQGMLQVNTAALNPITFITSILVHGNLQHLVGNVSVYLLVGSLSFFLNRKTKQGRFFLIFLLMFLLVLPLVYYPLLLLVNLLFLKWEVFVSSGLSLVVSGLIGFMIPSLFIFINQMPNLKINQTRFFLSMVFLTGSVIVFPYFMSKLYNMAFFFILIVLGFLVGIRPLSEILKFGRGDKKNTNRALAIVLILSIYFSLLALLFPTNIVQSSGVIVDILAHYFGVFFGLLIPYLIGTHTHFQ